MHLPSARRRGSPIEPTRLGLVGLGNEVRFTNEARTSGRHRPGRLGGEPRPMVAVLFRGTSGYALAGYFASCGPCSTFA